MLSAPASFSALRDCKLVAIPGGLSSKARGPSSVLTPCRKGQRSWLLIARPEAPSSVVGVHRSPNFVHIAPILARFVKTTSDLKSLRKTEKSKQNKSRLRGQEGKIGVVTRPT